MCSCNTRSGAKPRVCKSGSSFVIWKQRSDAWYSMATIRPSQLYNVLLLCVCCGRGRRAEESRREDISVNFTSKEDTSAFRSGMCSARAGVVGDFFGSCFTSSNLSFAR